MRYRLYGKHRGRDHARGHRRMTPLVLIHGWGMDGRVWRPMIPFLRKAGYDRIRVWNLGFFGDFDCPEPDKGAVMMGHSLGFSWGLRHPPPGGWQGAIAINAIARFSRAVDWPYGVHPRFISRMRRRFIIDPKATLIDFLRACDIFECPDAKADWSRLQDGLDWLERTDCRDDVQSLPHLFLTGGRDPIMTGDRLPKEYPHHHCCLDGGHVLPQSHPDWCVAHIEAFLSLNRSGVS